MIWSLAAQWVGTFCLLLWSFWLCCKLRLPAGFGPAAGICFSMVFLQVCGSMNLLYPGTLLLLIGAAVLASHRKLHELLDFLFQPGILAFVCGVLMLQLACALHAPQFEVWKEAETWDVFFESVCTDKAFALRQSDVGAWAACPQGLPALYALFASLVREYTKADAFFVAHLPLCAALGALFSFVPPHGRRAMWLARFCACVVIPAVLWCSTPLILATASVTDAVVGAVFAAALLATLLPVDAMPHAREVRGLALGLLAAGCLTVRPVGTLLAGFVLMIWVLQCLLAVAPRSRPLTALTHWAFWLPAGCAVLPPVLIRLAWTTLLAYRGIVSDLTPLYGQSLPEESASLQAAVIAAYWDKFRTAPVFPGCTTPVLGALITVLSVLCVALLLRRFGRRLGGQLALVPLCMVAFWPVFQLGLLYAALLSSYTMLTVPTAHLPPLLHYAAYTRCYFIAWGFVLAASGARLLPRQRRL